MTLLRWCYFFPLERFPRELPREREAKTKTNPTKNDISRLFIS